jgi:hypothetical protein
MARHPFRRVPRQGPYRPAGATDDPPLTQVVRKGGSAWRGRVARFTTRERQLDGAVLARRDAAETEPWRILTDLPPRQADARWDGMRAGIAGGSRDAKRGGWHGERTDMTDPQRAERRWLTVASATLRVVRVGGAAGVAHPAPQVEALPAPRSARQRARGRRAPRALSCFRRGRLAPVTAVLDGDSLPVRRVIPERGSKRRDTAHAPPSEALPLQNAAEQKPLHLRAPAPASAGRDPHHRPDDCRRGMARQSAGRARPPPGGNPCAR